MKKVNFYFKFLQKFEITCNAARNSMLEILNFYLGSKQTLVNNVFSMQNDFWIKRINQTPRLIFNQLGQGQATLIGGSGGGIFEIPPQPRILNTPLNRNTPLRIFEISHAWSRVHYILENHCPLSLTCFQFYNLHSILIEK